MTNKPRSLVFLLLGLVPLALPARAAVNLVVNGDFETETIGGAPGSGSFEFGSRYNAGAVQLSGWSTDGYNFVFTPGTADSTGAVGEYGSLSLWGPNNGAANGMPATSPTGGNFVAADGAYGTSPITQTINGLKVGAQYLLSFYWGAAQQRGFDGPTSENWTVGFGGQSFTTPTVNNTDHGFVSWRQQTYVFTATSASQVLSFLAYGTPSGTPPFSLLDGVSLTAAPEPATWLLMMAGLGGVLLLARRRTARDAPRRPDAPA